MDALERIGQTGILPLVTAGEPADAAAVAGALLAGGVDVMALSFCETVPALLAAVTQAHRELCAGVSGITTVEQCRLAVEGGAAFLTTPGYCDEIAAWCQQRRICLIPGCVDPGQIMAAAARGLRTVGFFPAEAFGGPEKLRALAEAFPGMSFLPGGPLELAQMAPYFSLPFVHGVATSRLWGRPGRRELPAVTDAAGKALQVSLGYELAHVGINAADGEESLSICGALEQAFGLPTKKGNSSNFAGTAVEVMKAPYLGANGHIAIRTNSIPRAAAQLRRRGFALREDTAKFKGGRMTAVYLEREFGGFAVHLLQR